MLGKMQLFVKKIERLFGKFSSYALLPNDMVSVVFAVLLDEVRFFKKIGIN